MAERAILARERGDGRYAVSRSRWGGTDRALTAVCAGSVPSSLPVRWEFEHLADDFRALGRDFDYLGTEVCYRDQRGEITAFLSLWFGLPLASARPNRGAGALVEARSLADARRLRDAFRRLKGRLADALLAGECPATAPPVILRGVLAGLAGRERYVAASGATSGDLYTNGRADDP